MSGKHRGCCCGNGGATPCCGFLAADVLWQGFENSQWHFSGQGVQDSIVPDNISPAPWKSSGCFTKQASVGIFDGATPLEVYQKITAGNQPITIDGTRFQYPTNTNGIRKPLYRFQYYLTPNVLTEYVPPATTGAAWGASYWIPLNPYCGYSAFKTAAVESIEIIPGMTVNEDSPGLWYPFVGRYPALNGKYYGYAEKVTSFQLDWWIEPFRYPDENNQSPPIPVKFSAGVSLTPRSLGITSSKTAAITAAFVGSELGWQPYYVPSFNPSGLARNALPSIVYSLVTSGPGNGCPFTLQFLPGASNVRRYRGSVAQMFTRWSQVGPSTTTVGYPAQYQATGLRCHIAASGSNPINYHGSIWDLLAYSVPLPPRWLPLEFSQASAAFQFSCSGV